MPLSRSPTRREAPPTTESTTTHETTPSIPFRIKRKRSEDISAELQTFMTDMRKLFADFKAEQNTKFNQMYTKMEEVLKQNTELRSSVEFLSNSCDGLKKQVDNLQTEKTAHLQNLQLMENKLESYERQMRSTCIEIRNMPQINQESKEKLISSVINISKKINVTLQSHDIKDIFRIKSREIDRKTIIVELASVILKERIIKMYKIYNKQQSLNTEFLKLGGITRPIFISENLTSKMKTLFFMARDYAKINDFRYCWISNGKIFLRRREGDKYLRINDENGLKKLKESA